MAPYYQDEKPLEPKGLAGYHYLTAGKASDESVTYKPDRHFEHKGVYVMELDGMQTNPTHTRKKYKATIRVLILGESRRDPGQVVFFRVEPDTGQGRTSFGHGNLFRQSSKNDPLYVHWCTGLQIKWTFEESVDAYGRKTEKVNQCKDEVHLARKAFAKAILRHFDNDELWESLDFEKVKTTINENEKFFDVERAPKGAPLKSPLIRPSEETSQTPARPFAGNRISQQRKSSAANQNPRRGNQAFVTKPPATEASSTSSVVQRSSGRPGDESTVKEPRELDSKRSKLLAKFKREVPKMSLEKRKALRNDQRLKQDLLEYLEESIANEEERLAEEDFLMSYGMDLTSDVDE